MASFSSHDSHPHNVMAANCSRHLGLLSLLWSSEDSTSRARRGSCVNDPNMLLCRGEERKWYKDFVLILEYLCGTLKKVLLPEARRGGGAVEPQ